jgi:predicted amidohydrolase
MTADRLTVEEVNAAKQWAALLASAVAQPPFDLDRIIEHIDRYDSIAPIFDPTGWIKHNQNIRDHGKLFKAVRQFRAAVLELVPPEVADAILKEE